MGWHSRRFPIFLYLVDLGVILGSLAVADWLRGWLPGGTEITPGTEFLNLPILFTAAAAWSLFAWSVSLYNASRIAYGLTEFRRVFLIWFFCVISLGSLIFFLKYLHFSRLLFLYFCGLSITWLVAYRLLVNWLWQRLISLGYGVKRVLIVGSGTEADEVASAIAEQRWSGLKLVGFVDNIASENKPIVGTTDNVVELVKKLQIDEVIIALPAPQRQETAGIILKLGWSPVRVRLVPDFLEMAAIRATVVNLGSLPLISLRDRPIGDIEVIVKRAMDILLSTVALLFSWPLMLLISLLVKLDSPGTILFRQQRIGENGRVFTMLKFRTMTTDSPPVPPMPANSNQLGQSRVKIAQDDARITRVGHLLRRCALDELPQLFNVLRGEMSLVGPRPEVPSVVRMYSPWHLKRLAVKPGITGPMQVGGASNLSIDDRVKLELVYIQNYTVWEDLKMLAKTLVAVIRGKGVH